MRFRKAHKDINHDEVKEDLLRLGFSVQDLHMVGRGCPDMLLGKHKQTFLVELKSDREYAVKNRSATSVRRGKLEESQVQWIENWRGSPVIVARTTEEILAKISEMHPN